MLVAKIILFVYVAVCCYESRIDMHFKVKFPKRKAEDFTQIGIHVILIVVYKIQLLYFMVVFIYGTDLSYYYS